MRSSFRKYWLLLTIRERRNFLILTGFIVLNGVIELLGLAVVPVYIRAITDTSFVTSNNYLCRVLPSSANWTVNEVLIYGAIILFIIYLFKTGFMVMNNYLQEVYIRGREKRMSTDLFKKYLDAPITFHIQRNTSELIRNSQTEIQRMNQGFVVPMFNGLTQLVIAPLIFIALLYVNFFVSILSLVLIGCAVILYNSFVRKKLISYGKILQQARGDQIKALNQGLGGIKEVKVMHRAAFFINIYSKIMENLRKGTIYTQLANRINSPYLEFVALMGMLLMAVLLTSMGTSIEMLGPLLAFYIVAMFRIKQSVTILMNSYAYIRTNHITIDPIYADMISLTETPVREYSVVKLRSSIEIRDITYTYPGSNVPSVNNVSIVIKKGESIGIVGTTGAGKTTLVDVILGLLQPQSGLVLVDGLSIYDNLNSWQRQIGYIPQQIYLLDDSIRSNVAFAIEKDQIIDDDIWNALNAAQLGDFVRSLPQGLDTITGERGVKLSGGQRQRIGIARSLYHNPSILIMDEATAALDNKTEKHFIKALERVKEDHTMIIIAHRLSTIRHCDRIIVMEKGEINAVGNYDELLRSQRIFQELAQ